MPKINQQTKRLRATDIITGIAKRLAKSDVYYVGGKPYSPKELVAVFQGHVDALEALRAARVALAVAASRERKIGREVARFTQNFKVAVTVHCGSSAEVLGDFGWKVPKKPGPKTTAAKLAGVLKGQATRKARGTMGPKQRKKIRG